MKIIPDVISRLLRVNKFLALIFNIRKKISKQQTKIVTEFLRLFQFYVKNNRDNSIYTLTWTYTWTYDLFWSGVVARYE